MEKKRKRIRIIYWVVLILGAAGIGVFAAMQDLPAHLRISLIVSWALLGAIVSLSTDILWAQSVGKQLAKLTPILTEEKDADRYIAELTALMGDIRSPQLHQIYLVNMGAAYCEKNDYYNAKRYLEQVVPKKLAKLNRVVFWADMALVLFYLNEKDDACRIMEDHAAAFAKFQDSALLGGTIAIIHIFYLLAKEKKEDAKTALDAANAKWRNPRTADDLDHLAKLCAD